MVMFQPNITITYKHFRYLSSSTRFTMNYRPWTTKSEGVGFKSTTIGEGDGERKVAAELGTVILGPNSLYDMTAILSGVEHRCEVKKMDPDGSFATGVEGRNRIRPLKNTLFQLQEQVRHLQDAPYFTLEERVAVAWFLGVSLDELAAGTIRRIHELLVMLHGLRVRWLAELPMVQVFHPLTGKPMTVRSDMLHGVMEVLGTGAGTGAGYDERRVRLLGYLTHDYIMDPGAFRAALGDLRDMFGGLTLIFVHEKKGYCVWNDTMGEIQFHRITRGCPRFRVVVTTVGGKTV